MRQVVVVRCTASCGLLGKEREEQKQNELSLLFHRCQVSKLTLMLLELLLNAVQWKETYPEKGGEKGEREMCQVD